MNAVKAFGEYFDIICDAIVITVNKNINCISRGVFPRLSKLWALSNECTALAVKCKTGRVFDKWLTGEQANFKAGWQGRELGLICV